VIYKYNQNYGVKEMDV